jgi:hypothetical protein
MSKICIPIPSSSVIGVSSTPITTPSVNILRVEPSLTGLIGGAATDLDGLNTVSGNYVVGIVLFLVIGGIPAIYQLTNGTDATNSPFVIRPNDFASQTGTQRVWKRLM